MQVEVDGQKFELRQPDTFLDKGAWVSYFAIKADHFAQLAHRQSLKIKQLEKIIDKLS